MKANSFFVIAVFALVIIGGMFLIKGEGTTATGNVVAGNAQVVKMYVDGGRYVLTPNEFKVGVPVRIEADISRMPGCSKSIVISAFGVRKILNAGDNVIEFTPTKAGTFNIACSMNMYRGTFTVLDNNGAKADYQEPQAASTGSCGGSGGGCGGGCGGV